MDAPMATQLWIAARYLESAALLAAPVFLRRRVNAYGLLGGFGIITAVLLGLILFWRVFPDCYVEPTGLTVFKKVRLLMCEVPQKVKVFRVV